MRVVPVLPVALEGLLFQKIFPPFEPLIEKFSEIVFTDEGECPSDREQFLSRRKLRFRGEIPLQDLFLMEMAHLDMDVRKDLSHASSAVEDDGLEGEALRFQFFPRFPVHRRVLAFHESPENIPLQSRRPEHEHAVTTGEERDIGDEDEGLRESFFLFENNRIELFLDPWDTPSVLLRELCQRLLVPHVFFPKIQMFALRLSIVLELLPASQTFVPLDSIPLSILLYFCRMAGALLFLRIILKGIELKVIFLAPVCHEMKFLASRIFN